MIRVMRLWKNGAITCVGLFVNRFWAERFITSTFGKRLWMEDEKKPATKPGTQYS